MINGITALLLLILSVGFSQQMFNKQSMIEVGKLSYPPNSDRPYNGIVWWVEKSDNKSIKFFQTYSNGIKNGPFKGYWRYWDYLDTNISPKLRITDKYLLGNYKNGSVDGLWTEWRENGLIKEEGSFKEGGKDGIWTEWGENGQKKSEENYKDGEKDGLWIEWYENGQKKEEGPYIDGNKDGLWIYWD